MLVNLKELQETDYNTYVCIVDYYFFLLENWFAKTMNQKPIILREI